MTDGTEQRRRRLLGGWALSAALIVAGAVVMLFTGPLLLGALLFVAGAIGSATVTAGVLRGGSVRRE